MSSNNSYFLFAEIKSETYDEEVERKIDIGFPPLRTSRLDESKKQNEILRKLRKDSNLEKEARNLKCKCMDVALVRV